MWRDGKFVTLGWLSVSHGFTAEVMARQGFDALCVDMQHGLTDMNDVWLCLRLQRGSPRTEVGWTAVEGRTRSGSAGGEVQGPSSCLRSMCMHGQEKIGSTFEHHVPHRRQPCERSSRFSGRSCCWLAPGWSTLSTLTKSW